VIEGALTEVAKSGLSYIVSLVLDKARKGLHRKAQIEMFKENGKLDSSSLEAQIYAVLSEPLDVLCQKYCLNYELPLKIDKFIDNLGMFDNLLNDKDIKETIELCVGSTIHDSDMRLWCKTFDRSVTDPRNGWLFNHIMLHSIKAISNEKDAKEISRKTFALPDFKRRYFLGSAVRENVEIKTGEVNGVSLFNKITPIVGHNMICRVFNTGATAFDVTYHPLRLLFVWKKDKPEESCAVRLIGIISSKGARSEYNYEDEYFEYEVIKQYPDERAICKDFLSIFNRKELPLCVAGLSLDFIRYTDEKERLYLMEFVGTREPIKELNLLPPGWVTHEQVQRFYRKINEGPGVSVKDYEGEQTAERILQRIFDNGKIKMQQSL